MASKVYYRATGVVMVPVLVNVEFTVRTEDDCTPFLAAKSWVKTGNTEHRHGNVEDVQISSVAVKENSDPDGDILEELNEAINELIGSGKWKSLKSLEVVDAK